MTKGTALWAVILVAIVLTHRVGAIGAVTGPGSGE
jgi:hypothetical protein